MPDSELDADAIYKQYLDEIRGFMEKFADIEGGSSPAGLVLKYGTDYPALDPQPAWLERGAERDCFRNAAKYAIARDDLWYVEGFALDSVLPMPLHHAWLIDGDGHTIDPTWKDGADSVYFGIAFSKSFVLEMLERTGKVAGILANLSTLRQRRNEGAIENAIFSGMLARPSEASS